MLSPDKNKAASPSPWLAKFARLGLHRPEDFVLHLPLRYEDETQITLIASAIIGETVQVQGKVIDSEIISSPRRQLLVTLKDKSAAVVLRFLNFYPSQQKQLSPGRLVRARGELRRGRLTLEMIHPKVVSVEEETPLPQSLTPVYPTTEGMPQSVLRRSISRALKQVDLYETLPESIRQRYNLCSFASAIPLLHNPPAELKLADLEHNPPSAWIRLRFDELLAQQLSLKRARAERLSKLALAFVPQHKLTQDLLNQLPFALTAAQKKVIQEISSDLAQIFPMQRLLQGDVGSGKTVVAALAAAQVIENGYQVALMAPTEILAEQHFNKLTAWFSPLGIDIVWLSGSQKIKARRQAISQLESGQAMLAVGTHALIQDQVNFSKLGLAIVDEQHRFGVSQRLALRHKSKQDDTANALNANLSPVYLPHQLMMSATPIPRTLAMSYFADLDVSVIDELPPGRQPIKTKLISDKRRHEVLRGLRELVASGRQAYWVCPLIEESETLELQTAVDTHLALQAELPELNIALVHGKLSAADKAAVMQDFVQGLIHILVATTVIEVGVDVPNASLMIIEHAERFGLAQLHQLRGRVGRGAYASTCVLLYQEPLSFTAKARLRTLYETQDGFEIARRDLEIRGPGEFLGARQSGIPLLRFADLQRDQALIADAQQAADMMLKNYPKYVDAHLERWMRGREDFMKA